jgi:hypothetical protein
MTTHELARKLLQLPDVPVTILDQYEDSKELTDEHLALHTDAYDDAKGNLVTGPNLLIS